MNTNQARSQGYTFSGHYSFDKAEMKIRAADYRKAGDKAVVVTELKGYSVFIKKGEKTLHKEAVQRWKQKLGQSKHNLQEAQDAVIKAQADIETAEKELTQLSIDIPT